MTNRFILIAVLLVISALLSMALLTGFSVRRLLQEEIISQLHTELNSFARQVEKYRSGNGLINRENLRKSLRGETLEVKRALLSNSAILVQDNDSLLPFYFYKPDALPREVLKELAAWLQKPALPFYEFAIQGEPYLCILRPVQQVEYQKTVLAGVIISYASAAATLSFNNWMLRTLLLTAALGSCIAIGVGYGAARRIAKPLQLLQEQADRFAQRQFDDAAAISTGDELEALSRSLRAMGSSIKEHDLKQRTFFQNLSHELKTPLMSIQGYAEGMRDGLFPSNDQALEIIIRESQNIKGQIEDITYLLKMDLLESFFSKEEVSVNSLIATAINQIEGVALLEDIDLYYNPGEDYTLLLDGGKIVTVLTNLLTNGIKYGRSRIDIATQVVAATDAEDGWFCITIGDDGPGLSEADLKHIFERFYRGTKPGTGLGMAIAQQIAEHHQGKLEVANKATGGALFTFKLPLL